MYFSYICEYNLFIKFIKLLNLFIKMASTPSTQTTLVTLCEKAIKSKLCSYYKEQVNFKLHKETQKSTRGQHQ